MTTKREFVNLQTGAKVATWRCGVFEETPWHISGTSFHLPDDGGPEHAAVVDNPDGCTYQVWVPDEGHYEWRVPNGLLPYTMARTHEHTRCIGVGKEAITALGSKVRALREGESPPAWARQAPAPKTTDGIRVGVLWTCGRCCCQQVRSDRPGHARGPVATSSDPAKAERGESAVAKLPPMRRGPVIRCEGDWEP